jgi:hypothetical protein
MKKILATVCVLGGVIGSSIYAADIPKANPYPQDEKKIVLAEKEAAFQSTVQKLYEELKAEMNKQPAKKQDPVKKPASNPHEPEQAGKMTLGVINGKLKDDEDKVAASVNANVVVNNGRLENMVFSGHAGLAGIAMSFDVRTGNNTTNLSYDDKKGRRFDVTLRNYKDPIVRAQLKVSKNVTSGFAYDSLTNYSSAYFSVNHGRMNGSFSYENINRNDRTTMRVSYTPPVEPFKSVSVGRTEFNGVEIYDLNALGKIGDIDFGVSAQKVGDSRIIPRLTVGYSKKW